MRKTSKEIIEKKALKEFATKGIAGARLDAIAKSVKCNKATILYHFDSKERLYQEILRKTLIEFDAHMNMEDSEHTDLKAFLTKLTERFFSYQMKNPWFVKLLSWEIASGMPFIREIRKLSQEQEFPNPLPRILSNLNSFQEKGWVRDDIPPLHIFLTASGTLISTFAQAGILKTLTDMDVASFLEERRQAVIALLYSAFKKEGTNHE